MMFLKASKSSSPNVRAFPVLALTILFRVAFILRHPPAGRGVALGPLGDLGDSRALSPGPMTEI